MKKLLTNWNKKCYVANKIRIDYDEYDNEIAVYDIPKPYFFNYQPLTGNALISYMQSYGETTQNVVRAFVDIKYLNQFKEFDIAYLYGATPIDEEFNGDNANYIIKSYKQQNTKIMVIFEEIIK